MSTKEALEKDLLPLPVQSIRSVDTASTLAPTSVIARARKHVMTDVDPAQSTLPFATYCFMTGFINAVCYTAAFVWPAFHTGNVIQMALALASLVKNPSFPLADKQAITSMVTFLFGAFLGRIGDRMGNNTRAWLSLGTFIQALFTMGAAICVWKSGQPSIPASRAAPVWTDVLTYAAIGFTSASLGLQAIMAMRVKSQLGTTILMTAFWCELVTDPKVFCKKHFARDCKVIAIAALFLGGFAAGAIIERIGAASALGIGTAIRVLLAVGWLAVPGKHLADEK